MDKTKELSPRLLRARAQAIIFLMDIEELSGADILQILSKPINRQRIYAIYNKEKTIKSGQGSKPGHDKKGQ